MEFKSFSTVVLMVLTVFTFEESVADKKCTSYCGNATAIQCPSGYSCVDLGCGTFCQRSGKYQPEYCPMVKCRAISCPLGFIRDDEGCEGCTCANEDIVKTIEEQDYNSGHQIALHASWWIAFVYTTLHAVMYAR